MKKLLFIHLILALFFTGCGGDDTPQVDNQPYDLYLRDDAMETMIPLTETSAWNYKVVLGTTVTLNRGIECLLRNNVITSIRLLPVRKFDNNEGWGKYEYQALCYITQLGTVFLYMEDKILVGRYLEYDQHGSESVIWDFELPTKSTETSDRYFVLNRNVSGGAVDINRDQLHETAGYHTIDVQGQTADTYKKYTECKLFEYHSSLSAEAKTVHQFYIKAGVGLVCYKQFVQNEGKEPVHTYEQTIIE